MWACLWLAACSNIAGATDGGSSPSDGGEEGANSELVTALFDPAPPGY